MLHRKIRPVEKIRKVNTNVQEHFSLLGNLVNKSFQCHFCRTGTITGFGFFAVKLASVNWHPTG